MNGLTTNSIGISLARIPAGGFIMGQDEGGDLDERPAHAVNITQPFLMAVHPVTNAQYERFDPDHRNMRGIRELSRDDDDAVIFVNWPDAVRFCEWLSRMEGKPYRLPTEAEWEYACRAGAAGPFHTGDALPDEYHRNQKQVWHPEPVSLKVGQTPPNAWGLRDMHGIVEEWCLDWYGPYEDDEQTDPIGRADGLFKITRGGSHNTELQYLRSANRSGALPEDRHWMIGFRIVQTPMPETKPLPPVSPKTWARRVRHARPQRKKEKKIIFFGPQRYVRMPENPQSIPMYPHNHCPSITWCDNGDLLAAWFSCIRESGREMTILASRRRNGSEEWDMPSEFFKAPDRNMTGTALFNDGKGRLIHINGMEAGACWRNLALVMRTSADDGVTWSRPRLIDPNHQPRNQVISGTFMTREGWLIQPCDASEGARGGTAIHISRDGGITWTDPGAGTPPPEFREGAAGGTIAGIHAGVVQLADGSLMAFGRGDDIPANGDESDMRMPMSISRDMGISWRYHPSPFKPIHNGQRLVLMRLKQGQILLVSFTDSSRVMAKVPDWRETGGLVVKDKSGAERRIFGMYAALSLDEGRTWPHIRPVTPGDEAELDGGAWTGKFRMDADNAEPKGYLAATQTPDGMIHLISSALYYRFNLQWLKQQLPAKK